MLAVKEIFTAWRAENPVLPAFIRDNATESAMHAAAKYGAAAPTPKTLNPARQPPAKPQGQQQPQKERQAVPMAEEVLAVPIYIPFTNEQV